METTLKSCLLDILEDLIEDELTKFKFQLTDIDLDKRYNRVPKSILYPANAVKLAEILIQYYGEDYSKTVTQQALKAINQRSLAEKFCRSVEKSKSRPDTLHS